MAKKPVLTMDATEVVSSNAQEAFASKIAVMIDTSAMPIIEGLAKAKAEYEGGPFVVLNNVLNFIAEHDADLLSSLPDPHSRSGNNPAYYKLAVRRGKKETVKEVYFYDRLAELLPSIRAALKTKDHYDRSLGDEKVRKDDIPSDIMNMPIHTRMAARDKLNRLVSTAKNNVSRAFELYHQYEAFEGLNTVSIETIYALNENNQPMDGQDGRDYKVEATNQPIVITSTITGRSAIDTKRLSVNTFLAIDIEKAKAHVGGPTYQALMNTIAKGPDNAPPETGAVKVDNLKTFVSAVNDIAEYTDRAINTTDKTVFGAMRKLMESDKQEGEDFFFNIALLVNAFKADVDNPRAQVRYQALLNKRDGVEVKAVA